jgi:hypothetical protein
MTKVRREPPSDDQVREIILRYLYDRNKNATSRTGKRTGASATISTLRADLKASHGLSVQQIHSNLTYLESQGWIENKPESKVFKTPRGGEVASKTDHFIITALGIDRIGGPSVFTRDRFEGIRIEATGQNIITLGDGNQIDVSFQALGESLSGLREHIKDSDKLDERQKLNALVDIDTIQAQLARHEPNRDVLSRLWEGINRVATVAGLAEAATHIGRLIAGLPN